MPRLTDVSPSWVSSPRVQGMLRGGGLTGVIDRFTPVDVPQSESDALIWLYNHAGGGSWTNNTNWLVDTTVGNWFGVTVAGGHVTRVQLDSNNLSGNIAAWAINDLPSLTRLELYSNTLSGDLSSWSLPAALTTVRLQLNSFSGDLSGWTLPAGLSLLILNNNSFTGDISGWTLPAPLSYLYLQNNSFTGDISAWTFPAGLLFATFTSCSFSGAPDISANTAMHQYNYTGNALAQADVDAVLLSVYNRRMAFTWATPQLELGGTNAAPSGIYQAACPPGTGKEYAFELVNDSCGDGFIKWTVTFTP